MDSFTQKILERAKERQKIISDKPIELSKNETKIEKEEVAATAHVITEEQSHETCNTPERKQADHLENNGKTERIYRQNSKVQISSCVVNTAESSEHNIDVEIKVSSSENIRIEVEVKDQEEDSKIPKESVQSPEPMSQKCKSKLQRLAKLYTDGDISSPIHKTEEVFYTEQMEIPKENRRKCINKLGELAENISNWEDDIKPKTVEMKEATVPKRPWKQRAPQPPVSSPVKSSPAKTPSTPSDKAKWDRNMIDKLESQGFTRTDSNSKLVYRFNEDKAKITKPESNVKPTEKAMARNLQEVKTNAVANKVQLFQNNQSKPTKDPALLSVGEKKALFEKNMGAPLPPNGNKPSAQQVVIKKDVPPPGATTKTVTATIETPKTPIVKPVNSGIASKVAAMLEAKNRTISHEQIVSKSQLELQKDMDLLRNRHNRNRDIMEEIQEDPSDEEEVDERSEMIKKANYKAAPASGGHSTPPRTEKRVSDSPRVTAVLEDVKRIKVTKPKDGKLYPCLSDIEAATETEQEPEDDNADSSSDNSRNESYDGNSSYDSRSSRDEKPLKRVSSCGNRDDTFVLSDMDEYMDVPLPNIGEMGPTPPKQGRIATCNSTEPSHSFNYKNFNGSEFKSPMKTQSPRKSEVPILVEDGDNVLPLTHTVSFYRRQQTQNHTPVRQIMRQPIIEEDKENQLEEHDDIGAVQQRIAELNAEVNKQQLMIAQTSQALNLCSATMEFTGSTEQVEAERVLLLASQKRKALLHEIDRLKVERTLNGGKTHDAGKGTLTITDITLPLKREYVRALAAAGGKGHHVVCLVQSNEQIFATKIVSTVATSPKNPEQSLRVPGTIVLRDVRADFAVRFDVYCMQAQEEYLPHEVKYHINKKGCSKLTPKKGKHDNRLVVPPRESPGGPSVVKTSTFALTGYVVFSMQGINRTHWTLNNVPPMSPLEGTVEMKVTCAISVEHRGFLTMFEDICGLGAWHRRWCLLKGHTLSYWKYPDDEQKKDPIDCIDLKSCITKTVEPVKRDICARMHTILLERERAAAPGDKDTLTKICKGDRTIIRHLLSADTKEERIQWTNVLNKTLNIYKSSTNE